MDQDNDDYFIHVDNESLLRNNSTQSSRHPHRQTSLVRPERSRLDSPNNPRYYYAQKTQEQKNRLSVQPSTTGFDPNVNVGRQPSQRSRHTVKSTSVVPPDIIVEESYPLDDFPNGADVKSGAIVQQEEISDEDQVIFNTPVKRTLRRSPDNSMSLWKLYCRLITFWAPGILLSLCGMPKKERQMAWREKMALLSVIAYLGGFVAFITFGFSRLACGKAGFRINSSDIASNYVTINGNVYNFNGTATDGSDISISGNYVVGPWYAAGKDATFLFQNVNGNCKGLIKPRDNCTIPHNTDGELAWYFPCKLIDQNGSSVPEFGEETPYKGWGCHTSEEQRKAYYNLKSVASAFFTWEQIRNASRNLVVYDGNVLDLDLLDWLETDQVTYPLLFNELRTSGLQGYDLSAVLTTGYERRVAWCLTEIIKVGDVDSKTVGCIASDAVLYVSLTFILSVVFAKFFVAIYFRWVVSKKQGASILDNAAMDRRANKIEDWSEDIYSQGPIKQVDPSLRPIKKDSSVVTARKSNLEMIRKRASSILLANKSDLSLNDSNIREPAGDGSLNGYTTMTTQNAWRLAKNMESRPQSSSMINRPRSSSPWNEAVLSLVSGNLPRLQTLDPSLVYPDVIQQPPVDYMPFGFPLIHTICFVTCYSEDEQGLRTTLDSISTTDYPNSHKLIMVVCDGLIKGAGNDRTTPEIVLSMMEDFSVPLEDVKAYSYVAVASGTKRHNMAKVYAGFYKYDDSTVPPEKQQRVPIIAIVKCGTPEEQVSAKPGNRGKRDSQIILMSFLEKITFDERMTELEYQILENIWRCTGLMADFYEAVLMVDADTKVYPDSLTHMVAEMVKDPSIMGLCGETKIANKRQSWVTAIQVFEYYISHHQAKAFESVFGSVTCLPGCFSLYRIKAPKGSNGYWVPILANPDIVERYSDNVTDTLHKKNLLLLGEDRYLSSLMLRTFPRRKQTFVLKAACKTIAPDTFKVLLSQRRRWINSSVHNLFELVLIKDLCGTFCFSMQFVIFIELIGTLVLPLAICFTIYVIIFAIVSKPTPIITLVLLSIILGLPGLVVIVTATRWSYLVWMLIYLLALPIWNFVLPAYAYWKFDDFSWGETRTVAGEQKSGAHDDAEGEFDPSHIKMRTWREFATEEANAKN